MAKEYKDNFTLDGRVPVLPGVSKAKVAKTAELCERAMAGDRAAKGMFESLITTSDLGYNFAHLVNLTNVPKFDDLPRTWSSVAGTRSVPDFNDIKLYSLDLQWDDRTLGDGDPRHIAPVVPEATPYPEASFTGRSYEGSGLRKRGFRVGFSFEAFVNDSLGWISSFPDAMTEVALDTEEYEVYAALINNVGSAQQLQAGSTLDGGTVVANAPLSRDALIAALAQVATRQIDGRFIQVSGWNLIVPVGQRAAAEFYISSLGIESIQDGARLLNVTGYNPLGGLTVVESEYVTGTAWYLVPKPGSTRVPVLDSLRLVGHETAELRVQGLTGSYVGGAAVSPFEGSFTADTADFRIRLFTRGVLWNPDLVIWSDGSGS